MIETLMAAVIMAIGIVALVVAARSDTQVNAAGRELTQAVFLAQQLREWTLTLPFSDPDPQDQGNPPGSDEGDPHTFVDDLDDLMDVTFSPPRDATGAALADMQDWSQQVTIEWKDPDCLTTTVEAGSSDVARVLVVVAHHGRCVWETGWLVARRESQ
ncbi:MAG: hypothetical protein B1H04_01565 [Planctomycetales bacterium 4484_123]|nr:MAG: hypothetical protein B1H04_01565 [Planctomycetales bacterium 4484_123]